MPTHAPRFRICTERRARPSSCMGRSSRCRQQGFHVNLPHREALSPDAAYHIGPPTGREFPEGDPIFAVEIPSKSDYDPAAEQAMAEKHADYFACGTQVVWDVDLLGEDVIKSYKASNPENPVIFRRGDIADAEPAVPGWRMPVDALFG